MDITLLNMIEELSHIKEVAVIRSKEDNSKPKCEIIISKMSSKQKKLAEILDIQRYFIGTTKEITQQSNN